VCLFVCVLCVVCVFVCVYALWLEEPRMPSMQSSFSSVAAVLIYHNDFRKMPKEIGEYKDIKHERTRLLIS